jgi:hypothetical protein
VSFNISPSHMNSRLKLGIQTHKDIQTFSVIHTCNVQRERLKTLALLALSCFLTFLTRNKIQNINTGVGHEKLPENVIFTK